MSKYQLVADVAWPARLDPEVVNDVKLAIELTLTAYGATAIDVDMTLLSVLTKWPRPASET
jgi:hypothetical protein